MSIQPQLRALLADRHTPEARALFETLLRYINSRVHVLGSRCWPDLLGGSDLEEVVAEVLFQLMSGSLAHFRGDTLPELIAYVRTISDRCTWHRARRIIRERNALEGQDKELIEQWTSSLATHPDQMIQLVPEIQLSQADQTYLRDLLDAGSKVEFARRQGVSRAAVTQRVKRITDKIKALPTEQRAAVDVWLRRTASQILNEDPPPAARPDC